MCQHDSPKEGCLKGGVVRFEKSRYSDRGGGIFEIVNKDYQ